MDSIFLSMKFLIISWTIAILLAALSTYIYSRTDTFDSLCRWFEQMLPNEFVSKNSRLLLAGLFMVSLSVTLSVLMSLQPGQDSIFMSTINTLFSTTSGFRFSLYLDDLIIAFGIISLLGVFPIINLFFRRVMKIIDNLRETRFRVIKIQNLEIFTPNQMVGVLIVIARYVRFGVILAVLILFIAMVFSLYPQTDGIAQILFSQIRQALSVVWEQVLSFLPNIIALIVVTMITRLVLRLLRFLYDGLQKGKIRFSSIHPEVVEPTYQLARFLVIAFALVAAFPYIPGSSSPMFRGLSIFVGFLISLGSTSLITNIISGIVLTYSRGLKIGDRVKIGKTVGDVIDRTLLVTRVKTIKNEVITIPNVVVMQNEIVNYSAEARVQGLILHTSITIGYDVSWQQVQNLLVKAAHNTADILKYPAPFVLKTSLDNSYVSYELNAYTSNPSKMAEIYSELHQNILDNFNQAKVEIMSPTYFAFRDGQSTTIPKINIPEIRDGNGFRTRKAGQSFTQYREKTQPLGSRS